MAYSIPKHLQMADDEDTRKLGFQTPEKKQRFAEIVQRMQQAPQSTQIDAVKPLTLKKLQYAN